MEIALLNKFVHWNEVLSVFVYSEKPARFVAKTQKEDYTDPLGFVHKSHTQGDFDFDNSVMLVNGSVHLETMPLSYNKIPYTKFPRKLAIEHTTGASPWDFMQMVDLAMISKKGDPEYAQGCHLTFLMYKKFYDYFMKADFTDTHRGKEVFDNYKRIIDEEVQGNHKYINLVNIEPSQFWLDMVPHRVTQVNNDAICILMNWCNFKKASDVLKIAQMCEQLHNVSGKEIHLKLHSYCKESFLKYLSAPYIKVLPYDSVSKYDIIDQYNTYFVDGTGLGYELGYRRRNDPNCQIFNVTGFDSEYNQFEGVKCMGVLPINDQNDFVKGCRQSNYPDGVIRSFFPHKETTMIPTECYDEIIKNI